MGFSTGHADYINYESYYDRVSSGIDVMAVEPGFLYLMKLSSTAGLNFIWFQALFSLLGFALIISTLKRYSSLKVVLLFAYLCYPFFLDITQMRQFMVSAIVVFAVRFLEKFSWKNLVLYVTCIALGTTIHISSLIYLVLLLSYISEGKKLFGYSLVITAILFIGGSMLLSSDLYQAVLGLRENDISYESGMQGVQLFLYILFYSMLIVLCVAIHRESSRLKGGIGELEFLYRVALCTMMFIPFILLDFQFTRFFRTTIIVLYLYILAESSKLKTDKKRLYPLILLVLVIGVGLRLFGPGSGYYTTLTMPILHSNYLFNLF